MRIVAKFGGTSIGDGKLVRKAAESVRQEVRKGKQVAVVVSAMSHTTDSLVETAKTVTSGKPEARDLDEIMSMGERTSARVFVAALRSLGVKSHYIGPESKEWPVITDSKFGNAQPDMKKTSRRARRYILPLMKKGIVPVICGFLGRDKEGNTTTLGRGGSDITAFLMGKCLDATEVVIVTDAEGVMSADPRRIQNSHLLDRMTAEEIRDLAKYGARILHFHALRYKDPNINAKVIHFRHGSLSKRGTQIVGSLKGGARLGTKLYPKPLAMLTVVGEEMQVKPGVLEKAVTPLGKSRINIFGVSIGPRSFSLYVTEEESQRALEVLHETVSKNKVMKSVTSEGGVGMIVAESEKFIETPGVIARLTEPLAKEKINVIEIYSSKASISFFVNWKDSKQAFKLLKKVMKEVGA
jgi:aspartate kinase